MEIHKETGLHYYSEGKIKPLHLFIVTAIAIFVAELVIMVVFSIIPAMPEWTSPIADAAILLIFISPALYAFLYRPQIIFLERQGRMIKEITENKNKYETLVQSSPDCIKIFNAESDMVFSNKVGLNMHCQKENSVPCKCDYLSSVVEEDKEKFETATKSAFAGKTQIIELRHGAGFPRETCMEIMIPLKDADGKVNRIFGVSRDVSEYKRLEKMKNELTHMIVHDLSNPLMAISGILQLLRMTPDAGRNVDGAGIEQALFSVNELKMMIGNLLDINKMEESKLNLRYENFVFADLLREVADEMKPIADLEGKRVLCEAAEEMPAMRADKEMIKRVITNLITNAVKHTPADSAVNASAFYNKAENNFCVKVQDFGKGIPAEYHDKIFMKYFQIEDRQAKRGKGLGLTFCKMAVEAHDGKIWVESELDKGSIFYFTIPAK